MCAIDPPRTGVHEREAAARPVSRSSVSAGVVSKSGAGTCRNRVLMAWTLLGAYYGASDAGVSAVTQVDAPTRHEEGTHQELLARRGLYWKLYQLQYQGAERAAA